MPDVTIAPDSIDSESRKFEQKPLQKPVLLNSLPKSGSHLLRNILRMFVPVDQVYKKQFVQWPNLNEHLDAFDPNRNYLISAHLLYTDKSAMLANRTRKILLVRDPYDWVLAQARFFVSDIFSSNFDHIKSGALTVEDLLGLMIFGIHQKSPPLRQQYELYTAGWLATEAHLVRYEDLIGHIKNIESDDAKNYFQNLFTACGIKMPTDWKERVIIGSDRKQSATARENINKAASSFDFPDALPEKHKKIVDYAAPGLRALFEYT